MQASRRALLQLPPHCAVVHAVDGLFVVEISSHPACAHNETGERVLVQLVSVLGHLVCDLECDWQLPIRHVTANQQVEVLCALEAALDEGGEVVLFCELIKLAHLFSFFDACIVTARKHCT